jgi:citrate lyase subunit beta/citryl-CoA lyase
MTVLPPDLRRTWLFGPGADAATHAAMAASSADALIVDLEDFTPPPRRPEARAGLAGLFAAWRARGALVVVRINELAGDGPADLAAAMPAGPDVVALPMAAHAGQIRALDTALTQWEHTLARPAGSTEILPVCETAAGVVQVREMAAASARVRCALLGTEDLAADLQAERGPDGAELDYARRRFVLECRAAGIEPVDAPYTWADAAGAAREAAWARRLGYRSKALVRADHADAVNVAFTPDAQALARASALVEAFEAARARGEDRALVAGQWVEVPTWRNAARLLARAQRLAQWHGGASAPSPERRQPDGH